MLAADISLLAAPDQVQSLAVLFQREHLPILLDHLHKLLHATRMGVEV